MLKILVLMKTKNIRPSATPHGNLNSSVKDLIGVIGTGMAAPSEPNETCKIVELAVNFMSSECDKSRSWAAQMIAQNAKVLRVEVEVLLF
jgi:hypothetical protein